MIRNDKNEMYAEPITVVFYQHEYPILLKIASIKLSENENPLDIDDNVSL